MACNANIHGTVNLLVRSGSWSSANRIRATLAHSFCKSIS